MGIALYDKTSLSEVPWNQIEGGRHLRHFFEPLMLQGTARCIDNIDCEMQLMVFDGLAIPLVMANLGARQPPNAYVASLLTQYVRYTAEEILASEHYPASFKSFAKHAEKPLLLVGKTVGIEHVVFINNWLTSTGLWPSLPPDFIEKSSVFLAGKFPKRALVFRSVNPLTEKSMIDKALSLGLKKIVSRVVYMLDTREKGYLKKRPLKQDKKLEAQRVGWQWRAIDAWDEASVQKAVNHYQSLYLQRHSRYNPAYNAHFFEIAQKSGLLFFEELCSGKEKLAVQAYLRSNGVLTTPLIGYSIEKPQEMGIYRMLHLQLLRHAENGHHVLNLSSGAGVFKQMRGGKPVMEYHLVYDKHLPVMKKLTWSFLSKLSKRWGEPALLKYQGSI